MIYIPRKFAKQKLIVRRFSVAERSFDFAIYKFSVISKSGVETADIKLRTAYSQRKSENCWFRVSLITITKNGSRKNSDMAPFDVHLASFCD